MKKNVFYATSLAMLSVAWLCAMPVLAAETETEAVSEAGSTTTFPVTVVDAYDNEVTLDAAPTSIVSLAPTDTEILYAIGAGEVMTGRTDYCNYPEEATKLDSIGTYMEPNMELILSKSPDLVVASGFIDDNIRTQLEENGTAVYLTGGSDRESIEADITGLGTLTGYTDGAEAVVADMESEWNDLSAKLEKVTEEKSAFVDLGSLYSAGPGSLLDGSLSSIHVKNIAADADTTWPQLSAEKVVEANPDVYISLFSDLDTVKETAGLSDLACLQSEDGFIYIDGSGEAGDMIQRSGPRYVEGLKTLAELIYPEIAE
ncbi:MAG: helical backbone metal receptor [Lachnospiraceae bacterium]|nr:helical backbone metal receptor [Lachnospiraceae bacterium]